MSDWGTDEMLRTKREVRCQGARSARGSRDLLANHAMLLLQMAGPAASIDTVQNTEYAGDG